MNMLISYHSSFQLHNLLQMCHNFIYFTTRSSSVGTIGLLPRPSTWHDCTHAELSDFYLTQFYFYFLFVAVDHDYLIASSIVN